MMKTRHFLLAWTRNLAANRLLSAIAILGLAIGLAGATLMALIARIPLTYNQHVPDHDRTWLAVSVLSGEGMAPNYQQASPGAAAERLRLNLPDLEAIARLAEAEVELSRGGRSNSAAIYWADPNFFDLVRLPALHGDLGQALARPDGLVMTRTEALRHFGRADAVGEAIQVAGEPMILRAVIADPPPNRTDLASGIFASGLGTRSALATMRADAAGVFSIGVRTYLRLRPGASAEAVQARIPELIAGLLPPPLRSAYRLELVRIDRLALHEGFHPGAGQRLATGGLVAALVLFIAIANFVNLSIVLSARRRREIGVRKASGAGRLQIAGQFLGEAVLTVLVATILAAAACETLLPHVNAFLETGATFDYVADPVLLLWLAVGAVLLGLVVGAYPAFLLAALPPATILQDKSGAGPRGAMVRSILVTGQFAILIGLVVATIVVHQQHRFALGEALRMDIDQVVTVAAPCPAAFREEVAKLPGVRTVSCSGAELLSGEVFAFVEWRGERLSADIVSALPSIFALYGVRPLAGSLDGLPATGEDAVSRVVVNEAAVRRLGFASPAAAIDSVLPIPPDGPGDDVRARIVAVVPDFTFQSIETAIEPTFYLIRPHSPSGLGLVSIRLSGRRLPETLAAIDRLWRATGNEGPIERAFVSEQVEGIYRNLERSGQLFAIFSALAIFLSCLGLVGLSLSTAERRTKEIGIRKALGATTGQILMLLLWQLSRPVLWANLIAWPVAWWLIQDWLSGFAYSVPLQLWLFPAAGLIALAIALGSVAGLAFLVARQKPIVALRYE
ncbi:MAG TPA: FtsX-like permease family protein [Allosphingosinicella sp.]|nr:FtsX-like permease family protein [Allosphingosinicella sp.]